MEPQKPKSGRFVVRVKPEVHPRIETRAAAARGERMNDWIARHLDEDSGREAEELLPA